MVVNDLIRLDARVGAGVAKPGQRRRVEGPVSEEFASSNLVPRITSFSSEEVINSLNLEILPELLCCSEHLCMSMGL